MLSTEKLYCRRSGVTYSIDLYTDTSDVGAEYLSIRVGGNIRYAKIVATTDSTASHLRVQRSGVTKAVATTAITFVGVWSSAGTGSTSNTNPRWTSFTYYFDFNRVFSSSSLHNFRAITTHTGYNYRIDGVDYTATTSWTNHRLSTGNHTVSYYGLFREGNSEIDPEYYYSSGTRVI